METNVKPFGEMTKQEKIATLPAYRGSVVSKSAIRRLPKVEVGEVFWVELDEKAFVVSNRSSKGEVTLTALDEAASFSAGMTLYDMNKIIVAQEPILNLGDEAEKTKVYQTIKEYFNAGTNNIYLLYCRDIHSFTIIELWDQDKEAHDMTARNFLSCVEGIGDPISIDATENGGIPVLEIWVRRNKEVYIAYLLPFDNGVVRI